MRVSDGHVGRSTTHPDEWQHFQMLPPLTCDHADVLVFERLVVTIDAVLLLDETGAAQGRWRPSALTPPATRLYDVLVQGGAPLAADAGRAWDIGRPEWIELLVAVTDEEVRAVHHAMIRGMVQLGDPVNCRETHPHHDDVECTLKRAHQEVEQTPHRSADGVEWFALYCKCAFVTNIKQCTECGGSRRLLISREEFEAGLRGEESAS
jgi:hypothetical protein